MSLRNPKLNSCETCPYRIPMDEETWEEVRQAQIRATPEFSDAGNEHRTAVERQMFEGVEAHVDECPGYSFPRVILGLLADKIAGSGKLERMSNGGIRNVKAFERHCNNPFLETPEYAELAAQLTRKAAEEFEATQTES